MQVPSLTGCVESLTYILGELLEAVINARTTKGPKVVQLVYFNSVSSGIVLKIN
jgi:hypothetical protein